MNYLTRLKNLKTSKVGTDKTDKSPPGGEMDFLQTHQLGTDKTDKSLSGDCPECHGANLVTDSIGKYCIDCRRRPWERMPAEPAPKPKYVGVKWGNDKGYLGLTNPVSDETCEVIAKGLPKWMFDRLNGNSKGRGRKSEVDELESKCGDRSTFNDVLLPKHPFDPDAPTGVDDLPKTKCQGCGSDRIQWRVIDGLCLGCGTKVVPQ